MLHKGISLYAVTAFILSFVTLGVIQLPLEFSIFGAKFTSIRNIFSLIFSVIIAYITVKTLNLLNEHLFIMMKKKQVKSKSGIIMLTIVSLIYIALYFFDANKTTQSLLGSLKVLKIIAPILNTFIDEKSIAKNLGKDSGAKGWFIALFGGVLSHGPGYIWHPMLQELREKETMNGLIVAFIYARSIKLP